MAPEPKADTPRTTITTGRSPETTDRMMVGVCGAIWLVALAASVFATVALVRLASGHAGGSERSSSWLLYSIIVVSALVILAAIPLLLRARRAAQQDAAQQDTAQQDEAPAVAAVGPADVPGERVFGMDPYARRRPESAAGRISETLVDRVFLRGTLSLLSAMGLALTAVAVGTYLLADANDTGAWVALGLAGVITVAMPAVLVFFQRQLSVAADAAD